MHDRLVPCRMLLNDRNRRVLLILIQIWLWHCYELSIWLIGCDLLHIIYEWLHWFALDLFLWAIHISLENSICWRLGISILIDRFSDSNVSHLSSYGAYITTNLIVVDIGLPLICICYLNKLVLVDRVAISKWVHLVLYVISKLRPLLWTWVIINSWLARLSSTGDHIILLILLIVLDNLIMHSLVVSRHHYNSSLWRLLIYYNNSNINNYKYFITNNKIKIFWNIIH